MMPAVLLDNNNAQMIELNTSRYLQLVLLSYQSIQQRGQEPDYSNPTTFYSNTPQIFFNK